jgi:FKBP-type peptidyl-prolyl cis-trans isomerase FkpA
MRPNRFRPRLESFEDRFTPAADLSAAHQAMAGAAFLRAVSADPGWMFNPALEGLVQRVLREVYNSSQAAASAWGGGGGIEAIAEANMAMAQQYGDAIGIQVIPVAAPAPPAPTPPATDAGMTSTMPDPNASNWVALGAQGLKTWDIQTGAGDPVQAGDSITVFYSGWLASNGTQFDSRRSPSAPATFVLNNLIQGWQQGIVGMRPGGIRRLFVPAALGYGANGSPPNIPPNADLVFEIKLISHT